ncbi:CLUMA_CG014297, isoform A [Clunio marinus]|uniref:CLUMA_CG014297, isoform A n=1 Tax=Clunio marinus TaxID=568069 RepID=A0A1J1ILJ5_9DIPT|nr:CLUMA_CG014297, isoform A [Clunio marinus]
MESIEAFVITGGRGKGQATNVPERELIDQIKIRPLLYDKKIKDYRKPGASDAAWNEVASALHSSVLNCKKRWKSLRDTFIKYYRADVLFNLGDSRGKQKKWHFYDDLKFLKSHVELFRLEGNPKERSEPKAYTNEEKHIFIETEGENEVYEIKEIEEVFEDHLVTVEEEIHENTDEEHDIAQKSEWYSEYQQEEEESENENTIESQEIIVQNENSPIESIEEKDLLPINTEISQSPSKNIVDPDERYLMSCLPAFKRFNPQQKAYVRVRIEELFYKVEFENITEPKTKRTRLNSHNIPKYEGQRFDDTDARKIISYEPMWRLIQMALGTSEFLDISITEDI